MAGLLVAAAVKPGLGGEQANELRVSAGLGGIIRMGHYAPLTVFTSDPLLAGSVERIVIACADDTGARVTWDQQPSRPGAVGIADSGLVFQGLFRLGQGSGTIEVELLGAGGKSLAKSSLEVGGNSPVKVVDGTTRIAVLLGQSDEVLEKFPRQDATGHPNLVARITDPAELPCRPEGFSAARVVVAGGSGIEWLSGLNAVQHQSLEEWVNQGGHLILIANPANGTPGERLAGWFPGKVLGSAVIAAASRLESFAQANQQFVLDAANPLEVFRLEADGDSVIAVAENEVPLIVRQARGFGRLTWSAVDLTSERMLAWSGQARIMGRLALDGLVESTRLTTTSQAARSRQYGFQDLTGQLRLGLESFRSVRVVNFTSVAILAVLGVLFFAVGDFFLLRHVLRNRTLTWITFPAMATLLGGTVWWIAGWSRPNEPRFRSLDLLDIDLATGDFRSTAWLALFQPHAARVRLDASTADEWLDVMDESRHSLTWQGQPGNGLGCMGSPAGLNVPLAGGRAVDSDAGIALLETGFAPSSVRNFLIESSGQSRMRGETRLRIDDGRGRLEGTITNPLPFKISGCRLLHENFVYLLPRDLAPGESISVAEMTERTARVELTRRRTIEEEKRKDITASTRWVIADADLPLIAGMLMFHSLAGGTSYTTLTHEYHDRLEMSDLIQLNRAVLTGQIEPPPTSPNLYLDGPAFKAESAEQRLALVRLVVPVDVEPRSANQPATNQ